MSDKRLWQALFVLVAAAVCMGQQCVFTVVPGVGDGEPELPVFTAPPDDLVLSCATDDVEEALDDWLADVEAEADADCGDVVVSHDFSLSEACDADGWSTLVTWTAYDDCDQTATVSATVTLEDVAPPTIALRGEDPVVIPVGTGVYEEAGAEVMFGCGLGTAEALVGGDVVDENLAGTYVVTYDATDACGQAADTVTRTVHVVAPPTFTNVPDDLTLSCAMADPTQTLMAWLNSAEAQADPNCGEVEVASDIVGLAEACSDDGWTLEVRWTATDECGLATTVTRLLVFEGDGDVGLALVGEADQVIECHQGDYEDPGAVLSFACVSVAIPVVATEGTVDPTQAGEYTLTYELADACGHSAGPVTRTVTVVDEEGPEVEVGSMPLIWSPNGKYETLSLSDCVERVEDACAGLIDVDEVGQILSIYSDEPENATGDGNTEDDIVILDASSFQVRAERQGGSDGRVYGITFEVADPAGNLTVETCYVGVPHDQSGDDPVDSGPAYTVEP